ncbi:MAG: hypothetical protein R3F54_08405 [Alphaproteobacteria bacterium]
MIGRKHIGAIVIPAMAAALLLMPAKASAQVKPMDDVRADTAYFWRAFLGRDLTEDELTRQTAFLIGLFGSDRCEYACMLQQATNRVDAEVFLARPGEPEDLVLRDGYIAGAFARTEAEAGIQRDLVNEADPARVFDGPGLVGLMTEKDVVAFVNLQRFLKDGGSPEHHDLSREQIDQAAALLDQAVGSAPGAGAMPALYVYASAFWAGVRREWADLDDQERQMVREHIEHLSAKPLSTDLYHRLYGFTSADAQAYAKAEPNRALSASMDEIRSMARAVLKANGDLMRLREMTNGVSVK